MPHKLSGGGGGAAGGKEIINQKNAAFRPQGIGMHGNRVAAVFEIVALFVSKVGKLAFFAHGNEAGFKLERGRGGKNKTARINAHHGIDSARSKVSNQQ